MEFQHSPGAAACKRPAWSPGGLIPAGRASFPDDIPSGELYSKGILMGTTSQAAGRAGMGLGFVVLFMLTLLLPESAGAHARMLRSSPAADERVTSPTKVELWVNERLDDRFNSIQVFPVAQLKEKTRANLAHGEAKVDPKDRTHLIVELKALDPGD